VEWLAVGFEWKSKVLFLSLLRIWIGKKEMEFGPRWALLSPTPFLDLPQFYSHWGRSDSRELVWEIDFSFYKKKKKKKNFLKFLKKLLIIFIIDSSP
jgi:hypothetical protein